MWNLLKPLLFQFDAEQVHKTSMQVYKKVVHLPLVSAYFPPLGRKDSDLQPVQTMGLTFPNPIGLAAGFDKDAKYIEPMSRLGFGFIEIGTVTPEPQEGNPKPRIFRLPEDAALINRLGFNNDGVEACVERLQKFDRPQHLIIGGNIGKNKWTPNEEAYKDYEICFQKLFDHVDYFVVNVSSPNTPDLRELQEKEPLKKLLGHLQQLNQAQSTTKPILLKIAPDLNISLLEDITTIVSELGLDGMIVSNTTISRSRLQTNSSKVEAIGAGGLSGAPLFAASTELLKQTRNLLGEKATLIGVGGVHSTETARAKIEAGADLVQLYTGLIYEGPKIIRHILKGLHAD